MADFILSGAIDDRGILEAFKRIPAAAAQAGADAGKALDRALSGAKVDIGSGLLKSVETAAAKFPNVISSQLSRAASGASTPATQLGTLIAKGVQGGADKIPAVIGQALATAGSKGADAGQKLGTAIGTGVQAPLSRLLGGSITNSLASATGAAQKGGQQIGTGIAGGATRTLEQLIPSGLTRSFATAPAVGGKAGKDIASSLRSSLASGIGQGNPFQPLVQQGSTAAKGLSDAFRSSNAGVLAASAGLKTYSDEQGRVRTASGLLVPELNKLGNGFKGIGAQTQATRQSFADLASSTSIVQGAIGGLAFALTNAIGNAGAQALATVKALIQGYAELDAEIRLAAAAAGEGGGYDKLSESINRVGIEASGTTLEVAKLATELVRGGLTLDQVNDSLAAIVRGAEATGTGFSAMGTVVAAALKSFGLEASEATRVVDALVQGANSTATGVVELGNGFKYAAPIAKLLGVSIEDLTATIGLFANAGISAEEAGVALRNGLSKLAGAAPQTGGKVQELTGQAKIAADAMKTLGINIFNADGTMKPMQQTLLLLKGAFDKLGPASRIRLASNLFGGEDDGAKFLAVLGQSREEIIKVTNELGNSKGATDKARTAMQSFSLSVKQLQGTLDAIGLSLGKVAATALLPFIGAANLILGAIAALPGPVRDLTAAVLLLGGAYVTVRIAQVAWSAALKTEAVTTAVAEISNLSNILRGRLVADLAAARVATVNFIKSINIANIRAVATSLVQLGNAAKAQLVAGLLSGAEASLALRRGLIATEQASQQAQAGLTGVSAVLNRGVTASANAGSTALLGVSKALSGLAAGTVGTALGTVAIGLAGVVAAVAGYNAIMSDANQVTQAATPVIAELEAGLKKLGVPIEDTTALGGPFNRFFQDATGNIAAFAQALVPIPGVGDAAKTALGSLWEVIKATPFGLAIDQQLKFIGGLQQLYAEAQNNQAIVELSNVYNKVAAQTEAALNDTRAFTAELKLLQGVGSLDAGKSEELKNVRTQIDLVRTASIKLRDGLKQQAAAALAAGNPALADALLKQSEAYGKQVAQIDATVLALDREFERRTGVAAALQGQTIALSELNKELAKREASNQLALLEAEAAAMAQVAAGTLRAGEAARAKEAATVQALQNEIKMIDDNIGKLSELDQVSAEGIALKTKRAEKALQLSQLEASATDRLLAAERALAQVRAEAPVRTAELQIKAVDRQVQGYNTLLNLSRAISDLEASRFSLQGAFLNAQLEEAQQRGASEKTINQIKAQAAQVEAQAARARLAGLQRSQEIELKILELTQKKALLDAQQGVNNAKVAVLQKQAALQDAINKGDEQAAIAARAALGYAQQEVDIANQNLGLVKQLQPLEKQIALAGMERVQNEGKAAAFTAQFKANLAQAVAPGGELANTAGKTAVRFGDLNADTQALVRNLSSSNGIVGELSRRMLSVSKGGTIAADSARQIGLFGRGSVGSYGSIGENLLTAGQSAEAFAGSGIDAATNAAAQGAGNLRTNMAAATGSAAEFYRILADASGLPGARWAGGPVEAGGKYRINDGPGRRSLGQESFLSSGGRLSLINRAANSVWTAPSSGIVIPASTTAKLQEHGILPGGKGNGGRVRAVTAPAGRRDRSIAHLEAAIANLSSEVAGLRRKDWNVVLPDTTGARNRQMINMINRLA